MNTRTKIMVLAVIAAMALWGGSAFAAPQDSNGPGPGGPPMGEGPGGQGMRPMHGGPCGPEGIMGAIMQKLNLTDDQRSKVETILESSRDKADAARQAFEKARSALEDAVAGDANEAAIRDAAKALGKAIGDEAVLKAATMKQIKAVLTADQITKLNELKAQMKSHPQRPGQGGQGCKRPRPQGPPPAEPQEE